MYAVLHSLKLKLFHGWAGLCVVACSLTPCLLAQDEPSVDDPYSPLTLGQKYKFSLNKVFGFPGLLAIGLHASFDQADTKPHDWGLGSDAFGVRLASRFGRSLVRQSAAFGVRALDHEDPRYFVSGHGSPWKRTRYAIVHTFVVHKDDGSMMPAYSLFVSDFGMPFIAQQWQPGRFRTLPLGLRNGSAALAINVGTNIGREFWPDIRKKLLATHLGQRYSAWQQQHRL